LALFSDKNDYLDLDSFPSSNEKIPINTASLIANQDKVNKNYKKYLKLYKGIMSKQK